MNQKNTIQSKTIYYPILQGLNGDRCGWICRKLRQLADFVRTVPFIGERLASKIDLAADIVDAIDDVFLEKNGLLSIEYEPTPSESTILENWRTNRLMPFYRNLSLQLASINQQGTLTEQLAIANIALQKMCVVESYFATYETNGLSTNAVYLRLELINKIFEPLYEIIDSTFENQNLQTNNVNIAFNSSMIADYNPLISTSQSFTANCLNYMIEQFNNSANGNAPISLVIPNNENSQPITKEGEGNLLLIGLCVAGVIAIITLSKDQKEKNRKG